MCQRKLQTHICVDRRCYLNMTHLTQDLNGILWIHIEEDDPSGRVLIGQRRYIHNQIINMYTE